MKAGFIYLDVCALSRPFDEQHYLRIRLETEAVNLILSKVRAGGYKLVVSSVHIKEIEAIADVSDRIELQTLLETSGNPLEWDLGKARVIAEKLISMGFGIADAAHIAFAEQAGAAFISCDDKLVKKCLKHKISVWCGNPISFCEKEDLR